MSIPGNLSKLVGHWSGTNRVWLSPLQPVRESTTTAIIALQALGNFVTITYTWADEGNPQDGLLLIGYEQYLNTVKAIWIDSWHMQDKIMVCQGVQGKQEGISVKGSYSAPPGGDWGWQIDILPKEDDVFKLVMYNISPEHEVQLAVEAIYSRKD